MVGDSRCFVELIMRAQKMTTEFAVQGSIKF